MADVAEQRAPLDRIVDMAIALPTCALHATRRALPLVATVGTEGAARLVGRLSAAVTDARSGEAADSPRDPGSERRDAPAETAGSDVAHNHANNAAGQASLVDELDEASGPAEPDLPIDGYDDLAARQIVDRLAALNPDDLAVIGAYERAHRGRSTVLGKIDQLSA